MTTACISGAVFLTWSAYVPPPVGSGLFSLLSFAQLLGVSPIVSAAPSAASFRSAVSL